MIFTTRLLRRCLMPLPDLLLLLSESGWHPLAQDTRVKHSRIIHFKRARTNHLKKSFARHCGTPRLQNPWQDCYFDRWNQHHTSTSTRKTHDKCRTRVKPHTKEDEIDRIESVTSGLRLTSRLTLTQSYALTASSNGTQVVLYHERFQETGRRDKHL